MTDDARIEAMRILISAKRHLWPKGERLPITELAALKILDAAFTRVFHDIQAHEDCQICVRVLEEHFSASVNSRTSTEVL